ncbi:hypothetical protein BDN71DRAFT_1584718 [Pleurotus eryngii]|uniref:Fe2OG dioxygenase domain-containing protein n=1 Tax=Pleurotus eryngii TaxID=5323 RepID=A0A9P6A9B4_PLEER|nr:hypothetical protein BDN71DRAFT_1584718 [Pleurotus eryngii]
MQCYPSRPVSLELFYSPPRRPRSSSITETLQGDRLSFANPDSAEVELLAQCCEPATFRLDKEDVYDETYRKAGKLDIDSFAMNIDLASLEIVEEISCRLLAQERPFKAELYKLNVYGEGSFFKTHKDTPWGENMFGSLVLVLPVPHKGGELVLRQNGNEWKYDSSTLTSQDGTPTISYVAFYGDIEHEVLPVESGHRITLTYNLFFKNPRILRAPSHDINSHPLRIELEKALKDPMFMKDGAFLGWGLQYDYPVEARPTEDCRRRTNRLDFVADNLKGEDALVAQICEDLNLTTETYVIFSSKEQTEIVLRHIPNLSGVNEEDIHSYLLTFSDAKQVIDAAYRNKVSKDESKIRPEIIWWLNNPKYVNAEVPHIGWGNQASLNYEYGSFCLLIKVDDHEARVDDVASQT